MKPAKNKVDVIQILRLAVQVVSFIFLPALFVSAWGGVKVLTLAALHGDFNLSGQMPQIVAVIATLPVTALMGRFFCGWMCAFGAFGDFVYRVFGRFIKVRMNESIDRALKKIKYVLLAFLIIACWVFGMKAISSANPWDAFGMLATVGRAPDFAFVLKNFAPAFVLLVGIAIGSVFVERFFCRYFCPLGAVLSVVSRLRFVRVRKPTAKCGQCRACTRSCAMGIPLYGRDSVSSGECIGCMKCVPACPRGNVSVAVACSDVRPLAAGAVAVAALAGAYLTGDLAQSLAERSQGSNTAIENTQSGHAITGESIAPDLETTPAPVVPGMEPASTALSTPAPEPSPTAGQTTASASLYMDGTYTGSGEGYRGATTVSVTLKNDKITNIEVVSFDDDRRFFGAAYPVVTDAILQSQSPEVDVVSGATYSSNGIMSAVADALLKARM